jgi:hypothetical protein
MIKKVNLMAIHLVCNPVLFEKPMELLLKERINPIIPLEAKKMSNRKPKESRPTLELPKNPSTNFIRFTLCWVAGIISFIKECSCFCMVLVGTKGRLGISVNKNKQVGGMAIIKIGDGRRSFV